MNLVRYMYLSQLVHSLHIFATIAPPGGVHIFACSCSFRKFAPKECIFSHTTPVWGLPSGAPPPNPFCQEHYKAVRLRGRGRT